MKMLISKIELDSKGSRELIPLECLQCQKTHYRPKNTILRILNGSLKNTNKGCYCSIKCKDNSRKITKIICHCDECGKSFERLPKNVGKLNFCSSSCNATFYNKDRKIWKECPNCKKMFHSHTGNKGKYCSHKCQWELNKKQIYKQIENGTYTTPYSRMYRNYLIEKYGAKCMECGWDKINPKSNKPTIQLEHIDGNYKNMKLENLKLLCPNCHSLTPTFGGLNRGNGRHYRRLRYAAGKSS